MRSATKNRVGKDDEYIAWLHDQPCVCCEILRHVLIAQGMREPVAIQRSKTESAHVGDRGLSQKCPDSEAIPLCGIEHHREGMASAHKLQKQFWKYWQIDRDALIAVLRSKYEMETGRPVGVLDAAEACL